jgi:CO/xanthine dehydrogenase FAD-binding subunit
VELGSVHGTRIVPIEEYFTGAKKSVLRTEELIRAVWVPRSDGPQVFAKVGARNAMVIAVCSFALALHPLTRRVGTGIGSAGPVPLRAKAAEEFLEGYLEENNAWELMTSIAENVSEHFAGLVAKAARPIDDIRGSARYRRHALEVLARRTLSWCWDDYRVDAFGATR